MGHYLSLWAYKQPLTHTHTHPGALFWAQLWCGGGRISMSHRPAEQLSMLFSFSLLMSERFTRSHIKEAWR